MKIWRIVVGGFAVIGFLSVLAVIAVMVITFRIIGTAGVPPEPPDTIVLRLDMRAGPADRQPADPLFGQLGGRGATLRELVQAIDLARDDPRVAGLVGHFDGDAFGMATAQELATALSRFDLELHFRLALEDGSTLSVPISVDCLQDG